MTKAGSTSYYFKGSRRLHAILHRSVGPFRHLQFPEREWNCQPKSALHDLHQTRTRYNSTIHEDKGYPMTNGQLHPFKAFAQSNIRRQTTGLTTSTFTEPRLIPSPARPRRLASRLMCKFPPSRPLRPRDATGFSAPWMAIQFQDQSHVSQGKLTFSSAM